MTVDQLKKVLAEGKKHQLDPKRLQAVQKDLKEFHDAGKPLADVAKKNPEV
jgi:hypothetical protein